MIKHRSAWLKAGCALAAAALLMAQGPVVNSPAALGTPNDPSNQAVTQSVLPPPDTPTYTGSDISKTRPPPASDQTGGKPEGDANAGAAGAMAPAAGPANNQPASNQ